MEEKTLFSTIPDEMYNTFNNYGFYYEDHNYINVFRWMWTDLKIHPDLKSPVGSDKTLISFWNYHLNKHQNTVAEGYDNAIIAAVNFLYNNIDSLMH